MSINEKLKKLREKMKEYNIAMYLVNTADPHMSEYIIDYYKSRAFISGFTGSQGNVIVTPKEAMIFVDGRYHVQAEKEIRGSEYKLFKLGLENVPTFMQYIQENIKEKDVLAFDGKTFSQALFENLKAITEDKDVKMIDDVDLIGEIWEDRPKMPSEKAFLLSDETSGKNTESKIEEIREKLRENKSDMTLIAGLDDICWIFNIRGNDIEYNPVVISYAMIDDERAYIYIDKDKISDEIIKILNKQKVEVRAYDDFEKDIEKIESKTILLEKSKFNRYMYKKIEEKNNIKDKRNISTDLKAIKNKVEIENIKNAHIKDGVALSKFIHWLLKNKDKNLDELKAEKKLHEFRSLQDGFIEESFATISAYGANAAMAHYSASEEDFHSIDEKGLYLVDSGGQYMDGTTDVTRTIKMGPLSDEEKRAYTLVLMGFIDLMRVKFPQNISGNVLDILARYHMWQENIDFMHGTGHGVGYILNVHEGPQSISMRRSDVTIKEGMVFSVEPGVYEMDKYGIRIENLVVVEKDMKNKYGQFLKLQTLTYTPIDLEPIIKDMMTKDQIAWLNAYHKECFEKLSDKMNEEERMWLKEATASI